MYIYTILEGKAEMDNKTGGNSSPCLESIGLLAPEVEVLLVQDPKFAPHNKVEWFLHAVDIANAQPEDVSK